MAAVCPIGFDTGRMRATVLETYDRVAREPDGDFHFHRGPDYACDRLGYDRSELSKISFRATSRFAGVGNPLRIGTILQGETVLDHACGSGTDLLLAARRTGPAGKAVGVDMTPSMVECATLAAAESGLARFVEVREGLCEDLPIATASVDVVVSNGVLNLAPDKARVIGEIHRVLRPGGRVYLAGVVIAREPGPMTREDARLWAAGVGGALVESELPDLAGTAGFAEGRIVQRFDCFRGAPGAGLSRDLGVQAVNFYARKPAHA